MDPLSKVGLGLGVLGSRRPCHAGIVCVRFDLAAYLRPDTMQTLRGPLDPLHTAESSHSTWARRLGMEQGGRTLQTWERGPRLAAWCLPNCC
jgi:hypothetical protein